MSDYNAMAQELYDLFSSSSPHSFPLVARKVSQGEFRMITTIQKHHNDISSGELATAMRLSSGRTSILLNALEKKGYLEREKATSDHRVVHVHLSEQGLAICTGFKEKALAYGSAFLKKLGESDAQDFLRLVRKIINLRPAVDEKEEASLHAQ